ncbi:MAG: response regulator [Acidobacteriota bacterium]
MLLDIINDILDLSKIEAGRMDLVAQDFDLDEVLTGLAGVVGIRAGEKGLEFLFATAPGVPRRLRGDSLRLQQVLLNLTNNAIKFTEEGEIVVRVDRVGENADHVELRFMVKDTGIGISAQDASKLFEPFSQIDASSTRRYGGTGLGLVISRRLVELMGGSLTFESTPGQGSTFTFNARFGSAATDRDSHGTQEGLRGMPVLVADDNLTARKVLREMLTSLSFDVTTVASGEEALSSVEARRSSERPFGLVILDWKMPGMDGIEAARRLRAQPARIPVMLITAYGGEDVMRRAEAVADAFVTKPVSQSHLFNKVLEAVGATHRAPRSRAAAPAAAASSVNEARVLLVEDNEINREVAVELLGGSGVAVTIATNGREALELLERVPRFDAILMDVQMPEMDGMEATRRIRSRPGLAQIPIIAMTAHAMLGDRERFLEAGMSDYISKPIEEDKLLAVLSRWVKADPSAPAARPRRASELPDIPGLDVADGVRRTAGNQALYRRLLGAFSRDNATTAERLRSAIASDAREEALMIVHGLKGTASTISATKVAAAAAALEKALHARTGSDPLMAELEVELGSVLSSILAMEPEDAGAPVAAPAAEPPDAGLLRELEELLATQNTRALRCYESLKPRLAAIMPRAKMETLERSLQGLDFEAALGHIREMAAHLPEPIV